MESAYLNWPVSLVEKVQGLDSFSVTAPVNSTVSMSLLKGDIRLQQVHRDVTAGASMGLIVVRSDHPDELFRYVRATILAVGHRSVLNVD